MIQKFLPKNLMNRIIHKKVQDHNHNFIDKSVKNNFKLNTISIDRSSSFVKRRREMKTIGVILQIWAILETQKI